MKKICGWGFILMLIGMSLADSASILPTTILCTTGMVLAAVGAQHYEET